MEENNKTQIKEIEVELISFERLLGFSKGKINSVLESFKIPINESDLIEEEKERQKVKSTSDQLRSAFNKVKEMKEKGFSFKTLFKKKKEESAETEAKIVSSETMGVGVKNEGNTLNFSEHSKTKTMLLGVFFVVILALVGIFFTLPRITNKPEQKPLEIIISFFSNNIFKNSNNTTVTNSSINNTGQQSIVSQVDLTKISVDKITQSSEVTNVLVKKEEVTIKGKELTKEDIYTYIRNYSKKITINRIYFLTIQDNQGQKMSLEELNGLLGIKMMPGWEGIKSGLLDYGLMIYLEPQNTNVPSAIRLGILFIFQENKKPSFQALNVWERSIINDLNPLFMDGNHKLLQQKTFNNSSISPTRRYVNFIENQSVSLDYALASDGVIVVTSKNFGTSILDLLLKK